MRRALAVILVGLGISSAGALRARPATAAPPQSVVPAIASAAADQRWHPIAPMRPTGSGSGDQLLVGSVEATYDLTSGLDENGSAVVLPAGVTAVQAVLELRTSSVVQTILAHPCSRAADPATDGVVFSDLQVIASTALGTFFGRAEVVLPVAGPMCIVAPVTTASFAITVTAYADAAPTGAAYVDTPDRRILDVPTVAGRSQSIASTTLAVAGGAVPDDAVAVALWVGGGRPDHDGNVTLGPCGVPPQHGPISASERSGFAYTALWVPLASPWCLAADGVDDLQVYVTGYYRVGSTGSVLGPPQIRFEPTNAPRYTPVEPVRILDTRSGVAVPAGTAHRLDLRGLVPPDATAVTLNVAVTEPVGAGFVTVWACQDERPLASNLNYSAGQTVANAVTVGIGSEQTLCFSPLTAAHVIADLAGWYRFGVGDGYVPAAPVRAFDTRDEGRAVAAGGERAQDLSPLVAADATAVVLNVTVTDPTGPGFVTVYPCGGARPLASSVNFAKGATVPNLVVVKLPADKRVCFSSLVTTHLLADVTGWFAPSSVSGFVDITPSRAFDTREGGAPRLPAGHEFWLEFRARVDAWVMNVTATDAAGPGYVSVYPCDAGRPLASNLNVVKGQTVPNLVIAKPGQGSNRVCFFTQGSAHLLADIAGWYTPEQFITGSVPEGSDAG